MTIFSLKITKVPTIRSEYIICKYEQLTSHLSYMVSELWIWQLINSLSRRTKYNSVIAAWSIKCDNRKWDFKLREKNLINDNKSKSSLIN